MAAALVTLLAATGCSASGAAGSSDGGPEDAASAITHQSGLVEPARVHLGHSSVEQSRPIVLRAQQLYTFWNTGDTSWLDLAVDPAFVDRTLPAGRPAGREGPVFASAQFRAAVPDLACALDDLYVTGDTFTARLTFTGHVTGTLDGVPGNGQRVEFGAIDIQHVGESGRIVEDWHLEDNLTFQQQAGLLPTPAG
ncbi:MAG: ester cyclase [Microbacterium arborescens]